MEEELESEFVEIPDTLNIGPIEVPPDPFVAGNGEFGGGGANGNWDVPTTDDSTPDLGNTIDNILWR